MENQSLTISYASSGAADFMRPGAGGGSTSSNVKLDTAPSRAAALVKAGPVFVSPKGTVDAASGVFVLQYRNHETGDVKAQYPSKKVVEAYHGLSVPVSSSDESSSEKPSAVTSSTSTAAASTATASTASSNVGKSDISV